MRAHLSMMIREHLGSFLSKLRQGTTKYEFCPIPPVTYRRLDQELFCHKYYLKNLCDPRFEEWQIDEPTKLFLSCLEKWNDLSKYGSNINNDNEQHARDLLGVGEACDEISLREAFRRMSKSHFPQKV